MNKKLTKLHSEHMLNALAVLDKKLIAPLILIIGGGGSMILAHNFPLATSDIDAIPKGLSISELDILVKEIAEELNYPLDWLNTFFTTYSYTLPDDFGSRLITVYEGKFLKAQALGKNEMLIMKCYAHRPKDVAHAKALIKVGADKVFVEKHIEKLLKKRIPKSQEALDFFYDILEQTEE